MSTENWTLDEMCDEAGRLLKELRVEQGDARVSAAPDVRIVRYYTSLGLLDRPRYEGREARYARRHVLQVVAVKVLQAAGMPLSEVQSRLYGRSIKELEAILDAARVDSRHRPVAVRPVSWREVTLEPGLKILAEEGWAPRSDADSLEDRIRAAVTALADAPQGQMGGIKS